MSQVLSLLNMAPQQADKQDRAAQASRNKRARLDPNRPMMAQPTPGLKSNVEVRKTVTIDDGAGNAIDVNLPEGENEIPGELFGQLVDAIESRKSERKKAIRARRENVQRRGYGDLSDLTDPEGGQSLLGTLTSEQKQAAVKALPVSGRREVQRQMFSGMAEAGASGIQNAAEGPRQVVDTFLSAGNEMDPDTGGLLVSKAAAERHRKKDPAFRVASTAGEYGSYLIPGVNMVLGVNQGAQILDQVITKGPLPALKDVANSMNPAEAGINPEDRVLRAVGLLIGAWHLKGRAITLSEGTVLSRKMGIPVKDAMKLATEIQNAERSQAGTSKAYLKWAQETGHDAGVREGLAQIREQQLAPPPEVPVAPEPTFAPVPEIDPSLSSLTTRRPPTPTLTELATQANARREAAAKSKVDKAYSNASKPIDLTDPSEYVKNRWQAQLQGEISSAEKAIADPQTTFPGMGTKKLRRTVAELRQSIKRAKAELEKGIPDVEARIRYRKEYDLATKPALPDGKAEPTRPKKVKQASLLDEARQIAESRPAPNPPPSEPLVTAAPPATRESQAFLPSGQRANVRFEVVERGALKSSHDVAGKANPDYPTEFQSRDRSQASYLENIDAQARKLDPARLIEDFKATDRGAPVVNSKGEVLSGNGRVMTIDTARAKYGTSSEAYRKALEAAYPEAKGMKEPVLVQRLQPSEGVDDLTVARRSNQSSSDSLSAVERAFESADDLPKDIETRFEFSGRTIEDAVNSGHNRKLIAEYIAKAPEQLRPQMIDPSGNLSLEGRSMVAKALMARALGKEAAPILRRMYEEGDARKSVSAGLEHSSPALLKLRSAELGGNRVAGEVREAIVQALGYVDQAHRSGAAKKWFDQASLEKRSPGAMKLARALVDNPSQAATSKIFQKAAAAGEDSGGGLFGDDLSYKTGDEAISEAFGGIKVTEDGGMLLNRVEGRETGATHEFAEGRTGFSPDAIRIKVEPGGTATGVKPMDALNELLKKPLLQGKRAKRVRGAAGYYQPSTGATTTVGINSLEVAAHEIAHAIDFRYKVTQKILADQNLIDEAKWFWSRGGSGSSKKPLEYNVAEGFAEFLRSYMSDPAATVKRAPKLAAALKSELPAELWRDVEGAGTSVRQWAGLSAEDKTRMHIQTDRPAEGKLWDKWKVLDTGNGIDYKTPAWSQFKRAFFSELDPVKAALDEAGRRGARVPSRPSENPYELMRQFAYEGHRIDEILKSGMIDLDGNIVRPFQKLNGFKSIIEPLDHSTPEALQVDLSKFEAFITSQAIVERFENLKSQKLDAMLAAKIEELKQQGTVTSRGDFQRWLNGSTGWTNEGVDWLVDAKKRTTSEAYGEMRDSTGVSKMVGNDVKEAEKTVAGIKSDVDRHRNYRIAAARYRAWARALVHYAVEGGRYTRAQGREILSLDHYSAMHRVMDDTQFGGVSRGLSRGKNPVKEWTGSTREIQSPVRNLLEQTAALVAETDRNRAMSALVKVLERGRDVDAIGVKADDGVKGGIVIYRNGKAETWLFEKGLQDSLESVGRLQGKLPAAINWATYPAQALRTGVTMGPNFAVRNKLRDTRAALVVSRHGLSVKDILDETLAAKYLKQRGGFRQRRQSVKEDIRADERQYRLYGGGIANEQYLNHAGDWYRARDAIGRELTSTGHHVLDPRRGLEVWKAVLERVESTTRIAEMKRAIESVDNLMDTTGWTQEDYSIYGGQAARDLIDFAEGGFVPKAINRFIPFTNAPFQGLRATSRAVKLNPRAFAGRMAWRAILSGAAVYAWNKAHGEEALKDYDELPRQQKDFYMPLWVGSSKFIMIPKAYDLGLPSSLITRGLMALDRGEAPDSGEMLTSTFDAVSPVQSGRALSGPLGPFTESAANYDFFRDENIVPPWEVGRARSERDASKASRLGQGISDALFAADKDVDARAIDHIIRGAFGNMGTYAMTASDIGRQEKDRSAFRRAGDLTGVLSETSPIAGKLAQQILKLGPKLGLSANPVGIAYDKFKEARTEDEIRETKRTFRSAVMTLSRALGDLASKDPNRMTEEEKKRAQKILSGSPWLRSKRPKMH